MKYLFRNKADRTFSREIEARFGKAHRCFPLDDFARRIDDTQRNLTLKTGLYKWSALGLATLIPIFSTVLSVALTATTEGSLTTPPYWAVHLSIMLTLLTLLNSIFNPIERFKRVCRLRIRLDNLKMRAMEKLEALPGEVLPHKRTHLIVHDFDKELMSYQEQLIDLFLPELLVKTSDTEAKQPHAAPEQAPASAAAVGRHPRERGRGIRKSAA